MNIKKIKEMSQNKKVIIGGAIAGALIIAVAGTIIVHNKNNENNNIAIENELEDIELENETENEREEAEKLEELENKVASSDLTEEEKEEVENEIKALAEKETITTNVENTTNTNNNTTTDKVVTNDNNNTSNNNTSNSNSSNSGAVSNTNTHTHTWVEVYKDVAHGEEGHYETIVIKEAWAESIPVYEEREVMICHGCGNDISKLSESEKDSHAYNHMLNGENSGFRTDWKQVQVGTNTVNHQAVTEKKWIVDKSAWTEKVLNGYKCNDCGVSK